MGSGPGSGVRRSEGDTDMASPVSGEPRQVTGRAFSAGGKLVGERTDPSSPTGVQRIAFEPLSNAHDHGRPYSPDRFGSRDQPLELWLAGLRRLPNLDPYTTTVVALCQAARSGVSSLVLVHDPADLRSTVTEAQQIIAAAVDVGVRVALVVPIMDRASSLYGDLAALLDRVPQAWKTAVADHFFGEPPTLAEQLEAFQAIVDLAPPGLDVQLGPIGPQWCSDEALQAVAECSATGGHRLHMHLLESQRQRQWADAAYPDGLIEHLDQISLLSPRLAVAHGVWLRPEEIDKLAEREVSVVINTSSNLRLSSGVAPLSDLMQRGIKVALGLDSLAVFESGDMLREWELARTVHQAVRSPAISEFLHNAVVAHGHVVAGRCEDSAPDTHAHDALASGELKSDLAVASWDFGIEPPVDADGFWYELRHRGARLDELYVDGELIVNAGRVVRVDEMAAIAELDAQIKVWERSNTSDEQLMSVYRNALKRFYDDGCHQHRQHIHGASMTSMTQSPSSASSAAIVETDRLSL